MLMDSCNTTLFCIIIDLVQSATIFRKAAGVYQYLAHDVIPSLRSASNVERPPESTSTVCSVMSLICLAEAQVSVCWNLYSLWFSIIGLQLKCVSLEISHTVCFRL